MDTDDPRGGGPAGARDGDGLISCRAITPVLRELEAVYGEALVERVVAASGDSRDRLFDPQAQTSWDVYDRVWRSTVTEVQAEMAAIRAGLVQSERLAAMGRLVSGVAHEINNPLTGIRADAEVLQARRGEPDLVQVGVDIAAGVDRCSALVRNMLAFGRQQPILRQPLDLAVVVDRALMLLAYRIKMAEVDLERPAATGGPTVQGDPGQLQQVVHNLVENSLTALEGTALPRTLSIRLQDAEDGARLEVVDSGVGIPPGDRERVFEPFFTTHPAGKGTGLGLAICHGIVHSHGGEMEAVEPASGQGVALRVSLPSSEGESPSPDREKGRAGPSPGFLQPPASPSAGAAPEPAVGQSAGFRLLVVDDEDRIRVAISRLLSDYGHTVTGVGSAAAARDVLGTTPDGFDAILLDLRMPGESGSALYETLSAAQQRRVVFMTGALAFRSADAFLSQFWGRFVEKPFTYRDLLEVLTRVVRGT